MYSVDAFSRTVVALAAALVVGACAGDEAPDRAAGDTALESDLTRARVARVDGALRDDLGAPRGTSSGEIDTSVTAEDPDSDPAPATSDPAVQPAYPPAAATPDRDRSRVWPAPAQPAPVSVPQGQAAPSAAPSTPPPAADPRVAAPVTPPASTPTPAPRTTGTPTIAAGRSVLLATTDRVCTSAKVGQRVGATMRTRAVGNHGAEIPAGSNVTLEVSSVVPEAQGRPPRIEFRPRSVAVGETSYPVTGRIATIDPLQRVRVDTKGEDAALVIGGAVLGAAAGQAVGKDTKSTVTGAAAGAAAGAVAASANERFQTCLPKSARVRLTLDQPLVMSQ